MYIVVVPLEHTTSLVYACDTFDDAHKQFNLFKSYKNVGIYEHFPYSTNCGVFVDVTHKVTK